MESQREARIIMKEIPSILGGEIRTFLDRDIKTLCGEEDALYQTVEERLSRSKGELVQDYDIRTPEKNSQEVALALSMRIGALKGEPQTVYQGGDEEGRRTYMIAPSTPADF